MLMNVLSSDGRGKVYFNYAESRKTTNVIEQIYQLSNVWLKPLNEYQYPSAKANGN